MGETDAGHPDRYRLTPRDLVYLTETKGTWPRPDRFGQGDRYPRGLAETIQHWPRQVESSWPA